MSHFIEPEKTIPYVQKQYDVIVCGAGPAGIAAALSAAATGASTCLIETQGCLGGIWTSGSLGYILDGENKQGVLPIILRRLDQLDGRQGYVCDVEKLKYVLEDLCQEYNVDVRLHTRCSAAYTNQDGRLTTIVTESKTGREAWQAKVFIDTTGDGDLSALAGCQFDLGHEHTGKMQPMSLIALVSGLNKEDAEPFIRIEKQSRINFLKEIEARGFSPSYSSPALWHVKDDLYILMANHVYGKSGLDAAQVTEATMQARNELIHLIKTLRDSGGIWSKFKLISTGNQIGVREGRRIHGRYFVTKDDIINGVVHEDGICRVSFKVDVHALSPEKTRGFERYNDEYRERAKPYDIPLRALISRDVDGLLMAGRCISGDFIAHSSYRVTGNAVQMGQAAGALAAVSTQSNVLPQHTNWETVRAAIEKII